MHARLAAFLCLAVQELNGRVNLIPGSRVAAVIMLGLLLAAPAAAETPRSKGAAELSANSWPYPEPARRGATGYSPNYSDLKTESAIWDVYVNVLWRRSATENADDMVYYGYEILHLLDAAPARLREQMRAAQLPITVGSIRAHKINLPARDPASGCLLFFVKHQERTDLAADDCSNH